MTLHEKVAPEYVRQAGVADGIPVYFVVYPIFRHGSYGSVAGYQLHVIAGSGFSYVPGNYLIFPAVISSSDQPQAYLSVVPDGVRSVRWRFTCGQGQTPAGGSTCELFAREVTVPVHHNLAVLPITTGSDYPGVSAVTWYRTNGTRTAFTNTDRAVPFPGAPAWRAR